jgi:hypothetical protein
MNKIKLLFPFLRILVTEPSVITKSLFHAVRKTEYKNEVKKKYGMASLPEIDLLEFFPGFTETVNPFSHLYGTSLPIDIAVLKLFARQFPNCDYLEIGTWRGESVANVAQVAKQCVTVSLSNQDMDKIGWGGPFQRVQKFYSKNIPNVKHIEANSLTFDFSQLNQKFDLIFVDGDHSYEGVRSDTEKIFNLLKSENSVILWHDYVANYEQIEWEVFAGILDGTPADKRGKLYHISNTLFAAYTNTPVSSKPFNFPTYPDKNFILTIKGEKIN